MQGHKAKVSLTFALYEGDGVRRVSVTQDIVKVGKDPNSHLRVDDECASRIHAVIEVASPRDITLIDLGNEPGTIVNGGQIEKCKIQAGDTLQIGSTRIQLESAEIAADEAAASGDGAADDALTETFTYTLIKSGPDVNPDEVEIGHVTAVEVMILWDATVLYVQHLSPPRSFYVGEENGKNVACDYFIPSEKLGAPRAPIVLADDGAISFVIHPGARGTVELPNLPRMTLEEAVRNGRTQPCAELSGAKQMVLPSGGKARMEVEGLVFQVAAVPAGKPITHGIANADTTSLLYVGMSFLAHMGLVAAMAFFVPPLGLTDEEGQSRDRQYLIQQYLQAASEREQEQRETEQIAENDADNKEGGSGARAKNEEGSMGNPNSKETGHRYGIQGPRDNPDPHIAATEALHEAAEFGLIGILKIGLGGDPRAPIAPWGREDSLGDDPLSARGNMWGDSIGDSVGAGGFGLSGIGEGAGGIGEGIGLGSIGTLDRGGGRGTGPGFGSGHGLPAGSHPTRAPQVRVGKTEIQGSLPSEIIQRIVRQNYGRFRFCYEGGLRNNPSLQGRVAVRFVIGRDGAVSNVTNGNSDMPDAAVVACVVRAYYGLSFPQPEGGIVTVVYPIMFSPG